MKTLTAFAQTFGLDVRIMEGPDFVLEVRNKQLCTNNEPALMAGLERDLNSPIMEDRMHAREIVDIINSNTLTII